MKTAAIWWRVSTDDQKEISPDTQIKEALALAEQEGYHVPPEYIIGTDWGSLSVWDSPPMDRLKALIREQAIGAVFMHHADRAPARPAHRLFFRALCQDCGVAIRCCHGQVPDGEMGEFMEFATAWAKEQQVHRAQQGAKDGLRDRARIKGLPVNGKPPYGFRFRYELRGDKQYPVAIEPDPSSHFVAARFWQMALSGVAIRGICRALIDDGIPAPKGGAWSAGTLYNMLRNPIYGGRYYALRHEAVLPQRRALSTYGKSSKQGTPRDQWCLLEDFPIISPVVTWQEWEAVQARLKLNKANSARNAKRFYMLSGLLFCEEDGRRLRGLSKKDGRYFYYGCTLRKGATPGRPPCSHKQIRGAELEETVWDQVKSFLTDPHTFLAEIERQRGANTGGVSDVGTQLEQLERSLKNVDAMETDLVGLRLRGQVSDTAFERQSALLRAERAHYTEEMERQKEAWAAVQESESALNSLERLRDQILDQLASTTAQDRRWVLDALNTRVTARKEGIEISIGIPNDAGSMFVSTIPGCDGRTPGANLGTQLRRRDGPHRRWRSRTPSAGPGRRPWPVPQPGSTCGSAVAPSDRVGGRPAPPAAFPVPRQSLWILLTFGPQAGSGPADYVNNEGQTPSRVRPSGNLWASQPGHRLLICLLIMSLEKGFPACQRVGDTPGKVTLIGRNQVSAFPNGVSELATVFPSHHTAQR